MLIRKSLILYVFLPFQTMAFTPVHLALQVLTETASLNFGSITALAGSNCDIDSSGNVTGQCLSGDANASLGQIVVSGLTANADVEFVISGTNNGQLVFVSTADVSGGIGGPTTVTDGQAVTVTTDGSGGDITIDVYGQLSLQTNVIGSQSYTVDYNVQVNIL
jgi:hypothetical protein